MNTNELQQLLQKQFEWLHRHPELSYAEFHTTAYIKEFLQNAAIEIVETGLKTGLVARIRGEKTGKTIALRADIDALPIEEQTDLVYKSENAGCMHACGHDFHTAALLGAALLLKERQRDIAGTIKLIFQPAEESTGGSTTVLESGVLNDVTEIYGMHVIPGHDNGLVDISSGATFATCIRFNIKINGKGGHAAMPHDCIDPVVAASELISAAQCIVSRKIDPQDCVVVSFSHIEAGTTWNIIPDTAFLEGTIRALGTDKANQTALMVNDLCRGIEIMSGAKIEYNWHLDTPSTNNDPALCEITKQTAQTLGFTVEPFKPTMASEDFAVYQEKIRGVFIGFGIRSPNGLHHPKFCADSSSLGKAAELLTGLALRAVRAEFER